MVFNTACAEVGLGPQDRRQHFDPPIDALAPAVEQLELLDQDAVPLGCRPRWHGVRTHPSGQAPQDLAIGLLRLRPKFVPLQRREVGAHGVPLAAEGSEAPLLRRPAVPEEGRKGAAGTWLYNCAP